MSNKLKLSIRLPNLHVTEVTRWKMNKELGQVQVTQHKVIVRRIQPMKFLPIEKVAQWSLIPILNIRKKNTVQSVRNHPVLLNHKLRLK